MSGRPAQIGPHGHFVEDDWVRRTRSSTRFGSAALDDVEAEARLEGKASRPTFVPSATSENSGAIVSGQNVPNKPAG
jgi:hypothetical protein